MAWAALIPVIGGLLDKIIPDPEARAKAKLALTKEENKIILTELQAIAELDKAQARVNEQEAQSSQSFQSHWRPFIGWVCGVAFAYHFVIQPLLVFIYAAQGVKVDLPQFEMETLTTVLMGMLGLTAARSYEKIQRAKAK